MFHDSRAPRPGDRRGLKPRTPNFFPWLRGGLKPQHSGDPGLNGAYRRGAEPPGGLSALERAKELLHGKEREKKNADVRRRNGVVPTSRGLPAVLGGRRILPPRLGKRRAPATGSGGVSTQAGDGSRGRGADTCDASVRLRSHDDAGGGIGTPPGEHGHLLAPAAATAAAERVPGRDEQCRVRAGALDEGRGRTWSYAGDSSCKHRDPRLPWLGGGGGLRGPSPGFPYAKQQARDFQSQRDLTRPERTPAEGVRSPGSLRRFVFSAEVPVRAPGCPAATQGSGKLRPSSEVLSARGQNLTWVHPGPPGNGGGSQRSRKDAGRAEMRCSRTAVRDQIKRVVVNLEQVVGALKDVHQEMKEVVEQIDNLTSSIDLNAEEREEGLEEDEEQEAGEGGVGEDAASPGGSSSTSDQQRASQQDGHAERTKASGTLRGSHVLTRPAPPLCPAGSPSQPLKQPPSQKSRSLPSPSHPPPPPLGPSVTIETKEGSYRTSQGDHPSASPLSPSTDCPPTPPHTHAHGLSEMPSGEGRPSAGCVGLAPRARPAPTGASKPPVAQGRRGGKPPPYPHNKLPERARKAKEPREAPPYPGKRRLLSTTV